MYDSIRTKTGKQYVQKYQNGKPIRMGTIGDIEYAADGSAYKCLGGNNWVQIAWGDLNVDTPTLENLTASIGSFGSVTSPFGQTTLLTSMTGIQTDNSIMGTTLVSNNSDIINANEAALVEKRAAAWGKAGDIAGQILNSQGPDQNASLQQTGMNAFSELAKYASQNGGSLKGSMSSGAVTGAIGNLANAGVDKLEDTLMGDKTFNALSEAIDDVVRTTSLELSKRFPPWGLLAAGVLETANFIDKAAGKTVLGFEVGDTGSGFTGITTKVEDSTFRGSQTGLMKRDLARRQEQINMALAASDVKTEESFTTSARMNSVGNILKANQMALAGAIDTSLLGG